MYHVYLASFGPKSLGMMQHLCREIFGRLVRRTREMPPGITILWKNTYHMYIEKNNTYIVYRETSQWLFTFQIWCPQNRACYFGKVQQNTNKFQTRSHPAFLKMLIEWFLVLFRRGISPFCLHEEQTLCQKVRRLWTNCEQFPQLLNLDQGHFGADSLLLNHQLG